MWPVTNKTHSETWKSPINHFWALIIVSGVILINWNIFRNEGWATLWDSPTWLKCVLAVVLSLAGLWSCLYVLFRPKQVVNPFPSSMEPANSPDQYASLGLGPLPNDADPKDLYLDHIKRSITNILYEDAPLWFYHPNKQASLTKGFILEKRVRGEDIPSKALTMIGMERLNNIQFCIQDVLRNNIPGDLIETGSYRGGATLFMRAVLKAHHVCDRRIFICDAFVPFWFRPSLLIMPILQVLAAIPCPRWQRWYFRFLQSLPQPYRAFPHVENPSEDMVRLVLWNLCHPVHFNQVDNHSVETVKSNFARYGLLDDQVVFLKGFFSDTLPNAPLDRLAILRLDGDTYESTKDALSMLYHKLSPGGYLIVDDYNWFDDCKRAVDEFRLTHQIQEEICPIDNFAVYWKKALS